MKRWLPLLICLIHFFTLAYLARQHPFGTFATETDFYHFYATDAERIATGQFPTNTYQGPGYPAALALIANLTGGDLFTVGKWLSVFCAVLCGLLAYILFARMFGYWVGVGAQTIAIVSGEFPQFSINATTDIFFLFLCLITLTVFTNRRLSVRWRVVLTGVSAGLTYMTRYNGLFLLAACLLATVFLNLFEQTLREQWIYSAILIAAFLIATSPWLYVNHKYQGSPFYNTNYLNLATEFYPELVAGKTNQDGTRALEEKFHSFGDVLRYDPKRVIAHYPVNLWESVSLAVKNGLINRWVGVAALLGVVLALIGRRTKDVAFLLIAGLIYLLLMALTHWETRYYFFVMVLCAGFAVYAVSILPEIVRDRKDILSPFAVVIFAILWIVSLAGSRQEVRFFLASHPMEIIAARDYLAGVNSQGKKLRIVARKPHLPYLSRNEWVFFPQVKSIDEFRAWVESNRVDYIAIGKRELKERKELASLADPKSAPDWLKAVWVNDDPEFILYRPEVAGERESRKIN